MQIAQIYEAKPAAGRLPELDALRAFLSWWVVVCHIVLLSGVHYETLPRVARIIVIGSYPVDVFIILSGFVIAKLLAQKQEPYAPFILRRFMRLYPAFAVALLFAISLRPIVQSIFTAAWPPDFSGRELEQWTSETNHFWAHVFVHLPMLHGVFPQTLLPYSAQGLLPPAWSISLEWQYYLMAPSILFITKKFGPPSLFLLALMQIFVLFWLGPVMDVQFPIHSFLPQKLLLFLIGTFSYWIFAETAGKHQDLPWLVLFFLTPTVLWFTLSIPLTIWTATLGLILGSSDSRGFSPIKAVINLPWIQRLGETSYSTYLIHFCCIWLAKAAILRIDPHIDVKGMLVVMLASVLPLTFLASELLFRFVEKPGIQIGKRLADRIRSPQACLNDFAGLSRS
jgi:peptidoglycan/LPS O-acetylase OafA/YrhL